MKCSSCNAKGFVNRNGICRECEATAWERTQIASQRKWQDYKDKRTANRWNR